MNLRFTYPRSSYKISLFTIDLILSIIYTRLSSTFEIAHEVMTNGMSSVLLPKYILYNILYSFENKISQMEKKLLYAYLSPYRYTECVCWVFKDSFVLLNQNPYTGFCCLIMNENKII